MAHASRTCRCGALEAVRNRAETLSVHLPDFDQPDLHVAGRKRYERNLLACRCNGHRSRQRVSPVLQLSRPSDQSRLAERHRRSLVEKRSSCWTVAQCPFRAAPSIGLFRKR